MSKDETVKSLEGANRAYVAALDAQVKCLTNRLRDTPMYCAEEYANVKKQKARVEHYRFLLGFNYTRDYHRTKMEDHP